MGIKKPAIKITSPKFTGVADALFNKVQQRVLAVLFGNSGRTFYANEVIALAGSGTGAVQRELARLEGAGLVTVMLADNAFINRVWSQPKLWVIGEQHALAA